MSNSESLNQLYHHHQREIAQLILHDIDQLIHQIVQRIQMRADIKWETKATGTLHHLVTRTYLGTIWTLFSSTPKSTLMLMLIAIEIQMSAHRHTRFMLPRHNNGKTSSFLSSLIFLVHLKKGHYKCYVYNLASAVVVRVV